MPGESLRRLPSLVQSSCSCFFNALCLVSGEARRGRFSVPNRNSYRESNKKEKEMKILIVGAGMGGLCLAHGLRGVGIDVEVFERNTESVDGLPGFGIHLNRHGYGALRDCLPEENWKMFDTTAGDAGTLTRFYDEQLNVLAVHDDSQSADGSRRS